MTRLKRALILICLLLLTITAAPHQASAAPPAQSGWAAVGFGAGYMRFDHLSAAEGLSNQTVLTVLQDQQGFLWFGTEEGLNRYNGYSFTTYQSDPNDTTSLSDSYITATVEDPDGSLWVGTYYGGLNRLDIRDGSFERFQSDPADPLALPAERVTALLMTRGGQLWVGTRAGLSRLDRETGQFITYRHMPGDPDSLKDNEILSLHEDDEGNLWIGTRAGLDRFNPESETFTHFLNTAGQDRAHVSAITGDDSGRLWIGTPGGLLRLDTASGAYHTYTHNKDDPLSLSGDEITALYRDHLGELWVGIEGHGVNLVTKVTEETLQVIPYTHQDYDANSLSNNNIRAIFEDDGGLMWFGTAGGGVSKANPDTRTFGFYQHEPGNPDSPAGDNITALAYDIPSHSLWIGTAGAGLDRVDLVTGGFTHFRADPEVESSLSSDKISLLHIGLDGRLFVGTADHPLQVYDPSTGGFQPALPESAGEARTEVTTAITHDEKGNLWLSQESGWLLRLDPRSGDTSTYFLRFGRSSYLAEDRILTIHADAAGLLWLGTESRGLVRFDPEGEAFTIFDENGSETGPSHNSITDIFEDEGGLLWLGTEGGGLNRFDPETERFSYITAQNGLPSNRVYGIIPDSYGVLWLSTGNGLAQLNPESDEIQTYDTWDGLQGSEFNMNAYASGADSALFFGGVNGFNAFYPSAISANEHIPPVVISSVSLFDRVLATNINGCDASLTLTDDQNFLSFEFAALDYTAPERNQFAYIMEGLNEDTVDAGTRRYADYPNLPPGDYVFRLFAANADGVWNEEGACIHIEIKPPFYATWWFISLVGLVLGLSVVVGYRWRLRSIEQQRQQLAVEVFERTEEIERRRQIASGLSDVIHLLNTNQPLEMSLEYIVKQAVGLTAASKAAIFERQEDMVVARACYPEGETFAIDLTDPDSPSARALQESTFLNRLLIYSRLDPGTLQPDNHWELVSGEYRTVFCMPLLVEEQVYGGLALYYGEDRIFTQDEITLAQTLANQASLAITNERLKGHAQKAAVTAERNRLARDLHDAVTQTLFSTSLIAEVLPKIWEKDPVQGEARLTELKQLTRGALGEMRTLLMELRPSAFQDANPVELFKHLTDAFSGRTGVPTTVEISKDADWGLPVEVKSVFYRVAQEGLNNIFKHADASQVWFRFDCGAEGVALSISDDGRGFRQEDVPAGHMGLGIMAERADSIGADLTLVSQPGEGTTLRLVWQPEENQLK